MPRPITKSKPLIFRLTIEDYALLEARAGAKEMTVNQYVADYITRACERMRTGV